MKKLLLVVIISFCIMPNLLNAQFSLKPKPLPDCKTFLISEIGAFYRITSVPDGFHKGRDFYVSNLGLMVNLNKNFSLGATSYMIMTPPDPFYRYGLKVRGRRWLGSKNSFNLAAGIILYSGERVYHKSPAFSGDISFSFHDLFVIEVLLEILPFDTYRSEYSEFEEKYVRIPYKGTDWHIYTGIKIGSTPGLYGHLLAVVAGVILGIAARG